MTRNPAEKVHLPIYEDLLRQRGDAVSEARSAAEHTLHQATELLGRQDPAPQAVPSDARAAATAGDQQE